MTTIAGNKAQAVRLTGPTQVVTVAGASAASTNPVGARTEIVRVSSSTACYVVFGTTPVATVNDAYLAAGTSEYFRVTPGTDKIAALQVSGGGTLTMTECD